MDSLATRQETVPRVRFIRTAKELGFSLKEIAELLALRVDPVESCSHVPVRIEILYFDVRMNGTDVAPGPDGGPVRRAFDQIHELAG